MSDRQKLPASISPEQARLAQIFLPHMYEESLRIKKAETRFVHYTNASAAMEILRSKTIWMRNSSCMNDVSEVRYGLQRVWRTYRDTEAGKRFRDVLNGLFAGFSEEIEKQFNGWTPQFLTNTYLTCLSEHQNVEDENGRLSMWRAYGETTGVALVIKNHPFLDPSEGLGAYASPVAYLDDKQFEERFAQIVRNIGDETKLLHDLGREDIINRIFHMLRFAALSTKHPGFAEEKEWRVLFGPTLQSSKWITSEIITLNGVPQPVYKLPLENIPEVSLVAGIPDLLDRIIIGPTQFPVALGSAFEQLLTNAGVKDAEKKINLSGIPLRR
jgi:hypothetical protein